MNTVIGGVSVNGWGGYRFTRQGAMILLETNTSRIALPVNTLNAVAYTQVRNPAFLWAAAACFLLGLTATTDVRPSIGEYEIVDWYWWMLGSGVLVALYYLLTRAAVVITSGSYHAVLRGTPTVMQEVFHSSMPS
ncbi:hypothetical protein GCM10008959_30080 [Deinococcus seoulensis]|uniref:Uncharacterized protein n=1 Tax=Deinococcus seoulensis TaxID=1837379 RepID=A0ABQ2RY81_9DEIO|nr:hypothetical protein [Deinococcus seoulensis]GGR65734.1 hypothetical protein GCM10008959_30080 [Deinococcus seoulensis]